MASTEFFPVPTSIAVNGIPNTTIRWEDLNVDNFLAVFLTTWINPLTGVNTSCWQINYLEGGGTVVQETMTTYLFQLGAGQTLTNIETLIDAQASSNNLTKYTGLFAISNVLNTITSRDVLINDSQVVRRLYIPAGKQPVGNYTAIYTNAGNQSQYLQFFVTGDQGKAVTYYYSL